ncbi:hypothetical protein JEQ12_014462 [Ovis aries]|uniref:Homeobox domain-containing protein n=1 Tax=Ovis aries TaxID=9940 RepID=A0A836D457_SHEEP|nr:hypothetical protein JEQ12_014462 [Ovis aries]
MLPSAVAAHAGAYWDVVASSSLLNFPAAPGFGSLGKSFLIENLLRAGGAPPLGPPPPQHHGSAAALGAGAQVRPLPASPVPLKLCPAAEPVSPGGAPYGTRWAFQVLSPSADGARLPGRAPGDPDCAFQPPAPAPSKPFFLSAPPFYSACCGGSCRRPASPTAFAREESVLPLLTQESTSKARRGILRRAVFSEDQRKALEKMFQKQKYISKTDRKKLAINLGLKESQMGAHYDGTKPGNGNFPEFWGNRRPTVIVTETLQVDSCCRHSGRKQRFYSMRYGRQLRERPSSAFPPP